MHAKSKIPLSRIRRATINMTDDKKIQGIKQDILKSGIPLEIEVSSVLQEHGWFVAHQSAYTDRDTQEIRTIDIFAIRMKSEKLKSMALVVECKKSANVWAFYTQPKSSDLYSKMIVFFESLKRCVDAVEAKQTVTDAMLKRSHLVDQHIDVGVINYIPFGQSGKGKQKKRDDFFQAQQQVTKAFEYFRDNRKTKMMYPVIVFDGEMYQFDVHGTEIKLNPIEYLHFVGIEKEETLTPCLIDVVRKSYFPEFVKRVNQEFDQL